MDVGACGKLFTNPLISSFNGSVLGQWLAKHQRLLHSVPAIFGQPALGWLESRIVVGRAVGVGLRVTLTRQQPSISPIRRTTLMREPPERRVVFQIARQH